MFDLDSLRASPILAKLSNQELSALRPHLDTREVRKNAIIMRDGTPGTEMMIILSGSLRVYRVGERAKEITLAHLIEGDCVGEIALLNGGLRTANVISRTRTTLLVLSREDFLSHAERFSGLPLALAQSLAERLGLATGRLADIALLDVPHRLLRTLERMAVPDPGGLGRYLPRRPTHQELADLVGSSREVVSRCLKALEGHGRIQSEGKVIYLIDYQD